MQQLPMQLYSQVDPRWKNEQLGFCVGETIGKSGCKISCLGALCGLTPAEVNRTLKDRKGYSNGCLVADSKVAPILGMEFLGKTSTQPKGDVCIMETDHYKNKGVPQHFVLYKDGEIADPLEIQPRWKTNNYKKVSFRRFKVKELNIADDLKNTIEAITETKVENTQASQTEAKENLELIIAGKDKALEEANKTIQEQQKTINSTPDNSMGNKIKGAGWIAANGSVIFAILEMIPHLDQGFKNAMWVLGTAILSAITKYLNRK